MRHRLQVGIAARDPLVLAPVLQPRADKEIFEIAPGVGRVLEQASRMGAVAAPLALERVHRGDEGGRTGGLDPVFHGDQHRPAIVRHGVVDHGCRPVRRGRVVERLAQAKLPAEGQRNGGDRAGGREDQGGRDAEMHRRLSPDQAAGAHRAEEDGYEDGQPPRPHPVRQRGLRRDVQAGEDGDPGGAGDEAHRTGGIGIAHVTIVQNPLTSLADDVAATKRALDRQDGPTILVGHSWGGTVITEAGVDPKVAGLVYVSALSPDAGETTSQQYEGFDTPPEFVIDTHSDGFGFVKAENFKIGFAADVSDTDAAFMRGSQVPIAMPVFGTKLTHATWRTRPSWAVIATDDKAFDLRMLRHMANRIRAEVTEVAASYAVFMTQPKLVADVIDSAAKVTSRNAR